MVPITLLTGFLGAGKTSVLNHLLAQAEGTRLGVLVNDLGAVNIDAQIVSRSAGGVIGLDNGCICCSLADGLHAALSLLLRRAEAPQHIVIEASGVSDPFEIAQALDDPELRSSVSLSAIVAVVDGEDAPTLTGDARALVLRQLAAADLVLLNKADLLDAPALQAATAWVQRAAPRANVLPTWHAQVPVDVLLGMDGRASRSPLPTPAAGTAWRAERCFESHTYEADTPIALQRLHALLAAAPAGWLRVKGLLHLDCKPTHRCVLQATPRHAAITVAQPWTRRPRSQIVVIGLRGSVDARAIGEALG